MNKDLEEAIFEGLKDPRIRELYEIGGQVLEDRSVQSDPDAQRALEARRRREAEKLCPPPPLVI